MFFPTLKKLTMAARGEACMHTSGRNCDHDDGEDDDDDDQATM